MNSEKKKIARKIKSLRSCDATTLANRIVSKCSTAAVERALADSLDICCLTAVLVPYFGFLPLSVLKALCKVLEYKRVEAGEIIVAEGSHCDQFYTVVRGQVEVSTTTGVLGHVEVGHTFGEESLVSGQECDASYVATSQVDLLTLDRETFLGFFHSKFKVLHSVTVNFLKKHVKVFTDASSSACTELAHYLTKEYYSAGHHFAVATSEHIYFIKYGECGIYAEIDSDSGNEQPTVKELGKLEVGAFFGEGCIFEEQQQPGLSIRANTDIVVFRIPKNLFIDHVNPNIAKLMREEAAIRNQYHADRHGFRLRKIQNKAQGEFPGFSSVSAPPINMISSQSSRGSSSDGPTSPVHIRHLPPIHNAPLPPTSTTESRSPKVHSSGSKSGQKVGRESRSKKSATRIDASIPQDFA
ncbi:hypothetical protein CYMTET_45523 [Cymbomonas tetramitiformis]|uniref:Cyclic nucleotide-binding domain-containing protein n=1 Tax=Cymbomonas tetramitiformis TaxID=36881 RepID=A0AAE0BY21_9CHLO|nr:hypothetical protein CYMTET_45523 [Cymbomonas tetramitiformis]